MLLKQDPGTVHWRTVWPWIAGAVFLGVAIVLGLREYSYWFCGYGNLARDGWCKSFQTSPPWTLFTALFSAPSLVLTWYWREKHKRQLEADTQSQLDVARDGQVTERFTRAIEQLGSDRMAIRLGGIYALGRIAHDSPRDRSAVVETLSAFIRMKSPWYGDRTDRSGEDDSEAVGPHYESALEADVGAALTVVSQPSTGPGLSVTKADLHSTYMFRASLAGAQLDGANLQESCADEADLRRASLEGATLFLAGLNGARLEDANLRRAILADAELFGARLNGACLIEADLHWTDFKKATLAGADLRGATMDGTSLQGADLSRVIGLTREQLLHAELDADTKLPPEFVYLLPSRDEKPDGEKALVGADDDLPF